MQPDSPREKLAAWLAGYTYAPDECLAIESKSSARAVAEAPSDALRQVESALRDLIRVSGDCTCASYWAKYDKTDPDCAYHDSYTEVGVARAALDLFPALAQQLQEGERAKPGTPLAFIDALCKFAEAECGHDPLSARHALFTVCEWVEDAKAELTRTREALAVAEGALKQYQWRPISDIHEDYGPCVLMNIEDPGYLEVGSNLDLDFDIDEWTHFAEVPKLTQEDADDLVAALKGAPTGTPGAEGEPKV